MLVLTRRKEERIQILTPDGNRISIIVADIRNGNVRIGIDAPREYVIKREELLETQHATH